MNLLAVENIFLPIGPKEKRDGLVIATKFAAYPWRLTPGQFVKACEYGDINRLGCS